MLSNIQNSVTGKHRKRFEDIKNRYGRQVGSRANKKNISTVWNMGQFDIGQLGCRTSLVQHFRSLNFSGMYDVGPATWTHINGYIDVCKLQKSSFNSFLRLRIKMIDVLYKS